MTTFLNNYLNGQWQQAGRAVHTLSDPVTGDAHATTGGADDGLAEGFAFARTAGAQALQAPRWRPTYAAPRWQEST